MAVYFFDERIRRERKKKKYSNYVSVKIVVVTRDLAGLLPTNILIHVKFSFA